MEKSLQRKTRLVIALTILVTFFAAAVVAGESEVPQNDTRKSAGGVICEIKPHTGKPTLFVNGEPRFPMAFMSYFPKQFRYKQMAEHGVHVYSVSLTLTGKWLGGDSPVKWNTLPIWRGPDDVDLSVLEKCLKEIVDVDPDAIIFPRVFCDSPAWWDDLHPGEGYAGGRTLRHQSFSSMVWRNDVSAVLKKIVRFVSSSKYGDHVIGYMIGAGATEELATEYDVSVCAQKRFRECLFEQYGKDEKVIDRLFGKKIEAISIPSPADLRTGICGNFLDPEKSRLAIDYRRFHPNEVVDSALAICRAVKEESGGRLITGIFYGYTRILPDSGHLALRRALESKDVDFITTPSGGSAVSAIGLYGYPHYTETDSVLRSGKLFYSEIDVRTSLSQWISKTRPDIDPTGVYNEDRWFGPPTIPDSLQLLKAVFAKVLVSGWANWWFDLWGGWYDNEAFLRMFAQMQTVGDESIQLSRKSVAQIAVILDENAYRYLPYGVAQRGGKFAWIDAQLYELERIGAPYNHYLLDDLKDLDLSQYRMIVFLNAFVLSEDQRQIISNRCMSDNRLLVWMYAPGLIKDNLSADNVSSLLGMKFQMDKTHLKSRIVVKLSSGETAYEGAEVSPFLHVVQGADESTGRTSDNQIVVAEKRMPNCRNLFVSMPPLPWKLLQQYAKQAGVHIYSETGDVVIANENYLAISAAAAGKRTIRLPKKAALTELLAIGKGESVVGKGQSFEENTTFEIDFSDHTCRLFQISH